MTTENKPELVWHKPAGICSAHREGVGGENCHICQVVIEGYWGPPDPPVITCVCGMRYFDTCSVCPLCQEPVGKSL